MRALFLQLSSKDSKTLRRSVSVRIPANGEARQDRLRTPAPSPSRASQRSSCPRRLSLAPLPSCVRPRADSAQREVARARKHLADPLNLIAE